MFSTALSRSGYSPVATAAAIAQPSAPVSFASTVSTGSFITSANICAQTAERAAPPARRMHAGSSLRLFSRRSRCMRWQKVMPSYTLRARCFRLWFSDMPTKLPFAFGWTFDAIRNGRNTGTNSLGEISSTQRFSTS